MQCGNCIILMMLFFALGILSGEGTQGVIRTWGGGVIGTSGGHQDWGGGSSGPGGVIRTRGVTRTRGGHWDQGSPEAWVLRLAGNSCVILYV